MTTWSPWTPLLGGALIGASASLLLLLNGQVAGVSGILGGLVRPRPGEITWRGMFVAGMLAAGFVMAFVRPQLFGPSAAPLPWTVASGLLVGFGTRLGGGCTSGHGVCGLSRRSARSLAATLTFMATGALAAVALRHGLGGF